MNPEMDEERVLAQLERRLAQDDPVLAATMDALNEQFPDEPEAQPADSEEVREKQRHWRRTAVTVCAVIAFLGLLLTAVLSTNPQPVDKDPPPQKGLVPGSVHTQRRAPTRTAPRRCRPEPGGGRLPTDLPAAYPGGTRART
ncbi:DUF3040 domain-containing protein [Streptomyces spinoverrucosus]|uniref:DUF3040 domain-containing protein n=1 Tax=Streptomyces spinoverrucosus TaxID=284043 RepID=UPI0018C40593|nr:DUF3040 domain-containing protein [Streptomyces spinoverrucosus]MBG0857404.1 DUF3040 domain-containing protein [Streptomyces spinoverrucosus]